MAKGSFSIQLSGSVPARRDAELEIVSESTGVTRRIKPFLDGSAIVRDLFTGAYEVKVLHPNVIGSVVDQRKVRLFEGAPTRLRFVLPDSLFHDTPVRDIPDADLTPVSAVATATRDLAAAMAGKQPGDPIRSEDWNSLVGAVTDLASAVAQLTLLVSPHGHDHPEIEEKLDEVNGNLRTFSNSFGRQLAYLQRTLQALATRRMVQDVLSQAREVPAAAREQIDTALMALETDTGRDVIQYGTTKKGAYQSVLEAVGTVLASQKDPVVAAKLAQSDSFVFVMGLATEEATSSQPRSVAGEVEHQDRVNQTMGGSMYSKALGR